MMAGVVVVASMLWLVPHLLRLARLDFIDDGYALWGAGEMVEDYLEDHGGEWPRGWEDLRPYFDAGGGRVGGWSFDEYRGRVLIDWAADVADLEAQAKSHDRATFRVIRAAHWPSSAMPGHEPNEILHGYLRSLRSR
jgi:hypothetical protein